LIHSNEYLSRHEWKAHMTFVPAAKPGGAMALSLLPAQGARLRGELRPHAGLDETLFEV